MSMTADDCYARAAECDKRAGIAKRFQMKVQHRELAEEWRHLANEIERIASLRRRTGNLLSQIRGPDVSIGSQTPPRREGRNPCD